MKINYIEKPHKNPITKGQCCVFEHNGKRYYADKSKIPYERRFEAETMIFLKNEDGSVNRTDLYCDRTGKTLRKCIEEFILELNEKIYEKTGKN